MTHEMTKFMQNPSLGAICDRVVGAVDHLSASVGHFVVVGCPFSKIRVDGERVSQTQRDGRTDGCGQTMEGQHEAELVREGAILLPAHFTTLDTAKFAIRLTSLRGGFVKTV